MSECIVVDKFNKWFETIKNNRNVAFVVFEKNEEEYVTGIISRLQDYFLCYYESIIIVIKDEFLQYNQLNIDKTIVEVLTVSEDEMETLCRLQRTFFVFSNIFFVYSTGFDDDSYDSLTKDNCSMQENFAIQVMLDRPKLLGIECFRDAPCVKSIDWNNNYEWTSQDYLQCNSLEDYAKQKIEILIEQQEISIGETIYLYGSSKLTEEIIKQFDNEFHFIIADMNKCKAGTRDDGIEVVYAKEALYVNRVNEKILITVTDYKNVCQELVNVGYDFPRQVKPIRYKKDYLDLSIDEAWKDIKSQLAKWKEAYYEIRLAYPKEHLFVSPHVSGDIYLSCLYIFDYIRNNDIEDYVYLVSSKSSKAIAELFGIDAVIWDKEKQFDIVSWGRYKGFKETRIKKMHPAIGKQRGLWHFVTDIDYNTMMQKWIFNAPKRITSCELKQESADYLFDNYNLKKGKTVLISPYSYSVAQMDLEMFKNMVDRLIEKGYTVCTNIAGDEKALPNTIGLCVPYINCVDFLNKAGYFIGARSGFCDVVSTTKAKMVVLYRKETYKHFSLVEMGLKKKSIKEIIIDHISKEEMRDTIDKFVCEEG